jgi:hypothetical protein
MRHVLPAACSARRAEGGETKTVLVLGASKHLSTTATVLTVIVIATVVVVWPWTVALTATAYFSAIPSW